MSFGLVEVAGRSCNDSEQPDKRQDDVCSSPKRITTSISQKVEHRAQIEKDLDTEHKLQRLKAKFDRKDTNHDGIITVQELAHCFSLRDKTARPSFPELRELITALQQCAVALHPEADLAAVGGTTADAGGPHGITFNIFAELMMCDDLERIADPMHLQALVNLRDCMLDGDSSAAVAAALHLADHDIQDEDVHEEGCCDTLARAIEPFMAVVIIANVLVIGVSTDMNEWQGWEFVEYAFCAAFITEACIKLHIYGWRAVYFGGDWRWNWFDLLIVILSLIDAAFRIMSRVQQRDPLVNLSNLTAVRIMRLTRLIRLVRLIRFFKELSLMVLGFLSGLRTITWCVVLLCVFVYVIGVFLTVTVGHDKELDESVIPYSDDLFGTVPRSMFTVFRCLTDGCSSVDGTPLVVHMMEAYGWHFMLSYSLAIVMLVFGLFNLFMAIFVENTMQTAKMNDQKVAAARRQEFVRVGKKLKRLVNVFANASQQRNKSIMQFTHNQASSSFHLIKDVGLWEWILHNVGLRTSSALEEADHKAALDMATNATDTDEVLICRKRFETVLQIPSVQRLLDELELADTDRLDLFDVLDADGSGSLTVEELVSGILKVRGEPRKSDVIAVRLAMRSVQAQVRSLGSVVCQHHQSSLDRAEELSRGVGRISERLGSLEECVGGLGEALAETRAEIRALLRAVGDLPSKAGS